MYFRGVKISFSFGFFALWAWLGVVCDSRMVTMTLLSCLLHESGHILAMNMLGIGITDLRFGCGGITLVTEKPVEMYGYRAYPALGAGCCVNLIIFAAAYPVCKSFALINLALALFNLLPFSFLDGGMLIGTALIGRVYDADKIVRTIDALGGILVLAVFLAKGTGVTLPLTAILCLWDRYFGKICKNG